MACGDGEIVWADLTASIHQSGRSGSSTETPSDASRKFFTNDLKKRRHSSGYDCNIYAPDLQRYSVRPMSSPSSFPANAILCTLSRHVEDENRKTTSKFGGMLHSLQYTPVERDAAILQRGQEISTEDSESHVPCPKCSCMRTVASNVCPACSIQPHPVSLAAAAATNV
jgi:hypothetical protein